MQSVKVKFLNSIKKIFRIPFVERVLISMIRSESLMSKFAYKLVPQNYQYKPNTIRRTKIKGLNFSFDVSDYVGHLYYFGFKDIGSENLFKNSIGKKIIFDIGANIGYTAINMSNENNNKCTVYAFEPDPINVKRLEENVLANPSAAVQIQNIALGDKPAKLKLATVVPSNFGANRIVADATHNFNWVDVTTLDNFCKEQKITDINLIKIDVEGFEMNVLKGGKEVLRKYKPVLFVEINDDNLRGQNSSAQELIHYLESFYSKIFDAETMLPIKSSDNFQNRHFDIIVHE